MKFAAALFLLACIFAHSSLADEWRPRAEVQREPEGAIVRGDASKRRLALVFTGDKLSESAAPILETLDKRSLPAGFFVTGNFLREPSNAASIRRMVDDGHYVGLHSDRHPLYCDWEHRERTLIDRHAFETDLKNNLAELRKFNAPPRDAPTLFMPPYEWYNRDQSAWSRKLGVELINFTPGSGSNRDYAREGDEKFAPSATILEEVLAYERREPQGLNGFLLLMHLGSGRKDPFHLRLGALCDELQARRYQLVRVDQLLFEPAALAR